ncbi:DUF4405 domain-containing protein [Pelagicoccus sp. SDUM812003]|uniref:DUF4405 domain-containing protein n=1 Tax=Pelagicoccus sp. SDUM812003 TaxID=3041267 RepID=UPI002810F800|nr:DUF4405 domain-containing protein [Pelagicoccus sp. SDUM812003]
MKTINVLLFMGSAFMLGTGFALELRLPRGRQGHGLEVLGLGRHDWGELHWWVGLFLGALVIVHLAMHWKWIQRALLGAKQKIGLIGIAAGLVIFLLPLLAPVTGR